MQSTVDHFRTFGFYRHPGSLFKGSELDAIADELETYATTREEWADGAPGAPFYQLDERGSVVQLNRVDRFSDLLFDFSRSEKLLTLARLLLGRPCVCRSVEYFLKLPGRGAVAPHQDQIFYQADHSHSHALGIWIPLDDVDAANGCLEMCTALPERLLAHRRSSMAPIVVMELAATIPAPFVAMPAARGEALVHHSLAIHRSGPNRTTAPRGAVCFNYLAAMVRE